MTITANRSSEEKHFQAGSASFPALGGADQQESIETAAGDGTRVSTLIESEKK